MLLWEALRVSSDDATAKPETGETVQPCSVRLPYDRRCAALTKAGVRCRGRIHRETDFCIFHDPELAAQRRQRLASAPKRNHRRLTHLPDGYLRKLTNTAAVGDAMNRLYREVRLGLVTPEMGQVLFGILTRMLDSELVRIGPCPKRTRAARIRPKLAELLTRSERAAWRKAVANAPRTLIREDHAHQSPKTKSPEQLRLQAAS